MNRNPAIKFSIGLISLTIGIAYYILFRPPENINIISFRTEFYDGLSTIPSFISQALPTFFHTFGFSMLLLSMSPRKIKSYIYVPLAWGLICAAIEITQLLNSHTLSNIVGPEVYNRIFSLHIVQYFVFGVFDWWDLFSLFIAVFLSGIIAFSMDNKEIRQWKQKILN